MPPRKKARASAASTPLTETQPKTPQDSGSIIPSQDQPSPQNENIPNEAWTDEQETQLFKSMIRWKPTGLHKHFRMISIHDNMRSHGFITSTTPHTRIPGIWNKLDQLYDLNALDERENAHLFGNQPDPLDPEEASDLPEFQLPEDEFGELMWNRRFHDPGSEGSSSPPLVPIDEVKALYMPEVGLLHELPEAAKRLKEEATVASTPIPKNTKGAYRGGRAAVKGGRATKAPQSSKNNKRESTASESGEEEGDEEEEEENSEQSEEETAPSTRKTARGAAAKPKPVPRRGRKR
ncbi:CT20-domain-containing protein [Delitschia confertaspora ATCC 74209]|uniref:CT20-domain-containing protein n=1 Tax=Delitschia confertaspora ATCC 74209 TaxID=1513339 RepID=A0A9P4JKS6_9PLEO|nr:CT20-domain-containing protein [Delitschia confertaspora ATCC 74209]